MRFALTAFVFLLCACAKPAPPQMSLDQQAETLAEEAARLAQSGEIEAAASRLCTAAELKPHDLLILEKWAEFTLTVRDFPAALIAASRAAALFPQGALSNRLLGECHERMQNWSRAAKYWEALLAADLENSALRARLAYALVQASEREDEAREHAEIASLFLPELASAWHSLGMASIATRNFEQGEKALKRALELDPRLWEAHYDLSRLYGLLGRFPESLREAQLAAANDPPWEKGFQALALAHGQLGEWDALLAVARTGLRLNVRENIYWAFRCWAFLEKEEFAHAARAFEDALAKDERFFENAAAAISKGGAKRWVRKLGNRFAVALKDQPQNGLLAMGTGLAAMLDGEPKAAAKCFELACRSMSKDPIPRRLQALALWSDGEMAEAKNKLYEAELLAKDDAATQRTFGLFLHAQENDNSAKTCLRKSLELDPEQPFVKYHLADIFFHDEENLTEAEKLLLECRAAQPTYIRAVDHLGRIARTQNRYSDSLAWYREALSYRPHDDASWNGLGLSLRNASRWQEAIFVFTALVESDSENKTNHGRWQANRATTFARMGLRELARRDYEAAVQLAPNTSWIREEYADLLAVMGRKAEAEEQRERLVKADPEGALALRRKAQPLMEQRRHLEALPLIQQAITKQPKDSTLHLLLGRCLYWTGKREESLGSFEKALALDPENFYAYDDLVASLQALGKPNEVRKLEDRHLPRITNQLKALTEIAKIYRKHSLPKEALRLEATLKDLNH